MSYLRKRASLIIATSILAAASAAGNLAQTSSAPVGVGASAATSASDFSLSAGQTFSASRRQRPNDGRGRGTHKSSADEQRSAARKRLTDELADALRIIADNYGGRPDLAAAMRSAIQGSLEALDPHSSYFDEKEYADLLAEEDGLYSGIGATIASYERDGTLETYILATVPGSPARMAGLRFGDRIVSVDGEAMSGRTSDEVREKVRGRQGSRLRLVIERIGFSRPVPVELRRANVEQHSVADAYMLRTGVGYIELSGGFDYLTSGEFSKALDDLKRQGLRGLIIDLRDNHGGILEESIKIAEKFLPAGSVVVTQRGRHPFDNRVWRSASRSPETVPLVVLVNEGSASASEVVAGALQDNDRALIVGQRTFGKGLVQSVFDLPEKSGLTLTTARYYTPSGRSIQRDYSTSGLYDYYKRDEVSDRSVRQETRSLTNRRLFGGDGITPDEAVAPPALTAAQLRLIDPIFAFVRDTLARQAQSGAGPAPAADTIRAEAEGLFEKFESYLTAAFPGVPPASARSNKEFVIERLSHDLSLALLGPEAADRLLAATDPQVLRALAVLPRAGELAALAEKARRDGRRIRRQVRSKVASSQKKPAE
ncbi:MAG: S41 family peptidase [Pyrinomonadaceae bacterium]